MKQSVIYHIMHRPSFGQSKAHTDTIRLNPRRESFSIITWSWILKARFIFQVGLKYNALVTLLLFLFLGVLSFVVELIMLLL